MPNFTYSKKAMPLALKINRGPYRLTEHLAPAYVTRGEEQFMDNSMNRILKSMKYFRGVLPL